MIDFHKLAVLLDEAARTGVAVAQLSESHPDLDVTAGYAVQRPSIQRRRRPEFNALAV
jgi:2-oxo-3-hexenedioate decarboxylase